MVIEFREHKFKTYRKSERENGNIIISYCFKKNILSYKILTICIS